MSLVPGVRLGAYEVTALIGAGGMGEVYRARDTKLNRDVALKVLPELFALDPDRLARFKREAHVLASLNHPNIAAIYGLEESDPSAGSGQAAVRALVLELVEGPTLADRIAQGPIPIDEALPMARQIAEALEAAHEQGVVHRDLKPANIKVRPDGTVKVLDFGLAKALAPELSGAEVSRSPTLTSPAATRLGVVMGTAAYMSPEQARGKVVDKRTDIWAFGCVLYEMLTGKRAFGTDDVTDTLAAIVRGEPDWTALPADTPAPIGKLLRRSLAKDRRDRVPDIAVARLEINEAIAAPPPTIAAVQHRSRWIVVTTSIATGLVLGAVGTDLWRQPEAEQSSLAISGPTTRTAIDLPPNAPLALGTGIPEIGFDSPALALSPDGRHLAYVGQSSSGTVLYLREMTSFDAEAVKGTEGAIYAFFSPDGRSLGFLTNDKVKKVLLDGGAPITLCDALQPVSATWTGDEIYFSENQGLSLSRISAMGGGPTVVVPAPPPGAIGRRFTQVLPDRQSALVGVATRGISADYADIGVLSLSTGELKVLIQSGYDGRYVPSGHLLFGRAGSLFAVRFDLTRQEVLGEAVQVVSGASMESLFGQVHATASNNGLIAYVPGGERALGRLAWVDRQGKTEYLPTPTRLYGVLDLTADGARFAVHVADVTDYIWVYDFVRGEGRRVIVGDPSGWPVWSPDNQTIAFAAWRSMDQRRVLSRAADGGGPAKELLSASTDTSVIPYSWSQDGRMLAIAGRGGGVFALGDTLKRVGEALGNMPNFSPDGHWIAYGLNEAGRSDIFVRSYPDGKITRQFSTDGGIEPVWCGCGELFYRKGNQWMSSVVRTDPELRWDPPKLAFQTDFIDTPGRSYDVSPDGKRLLVVKQAEPDVRSRIHVVTNWLEQLNQRETGDGR